MYAARKADVFRPETEGGGALDPPKHCGANALMYTSGSFVMDVAIPVKVEYAAGLTTLPRGFPMTRRQTDPTSAAHLR